MAVSIRNSFHTSLCETIYMDILTGKDVYYYFLSNTVPWNLQDLPPSYTGTDQEETQARNEIVATKKILPSDVAFGVTRYDWQSGEFYDMYDSSVQMNGKKFYVLTDTFDVYKCLDNNSGSPSSIEPTGTSYSPVRTADGYLWKYLYTIPLSLRNKFLLPDVMPVFKSLFEPFYDSGSINQVSILDGGSGYENSPSVTITVTGGSPSIPAVLIPVIGADGSFKSVYIKDAGTGYLSAPTLTINGNPGATGKYGNPYAVLQAVILAGKVDRVNVLDPGTGYTNDTRTTITIQGDGTGASFTPVIDEGTIIDVVLDNPGTGYTFADLDVVSALDPDTLAPAGSGARLQADLSVGNLDTDQALVEQTALRGAVHSVKITNQGANYLAPPTVVLTGDGTGFSAVSVLELGRVIRIDVITPGLNYTQGSIQLVGGGGSGAVASPIFSPLSGHGFNAVEELLVDSIILSSTIANESILGLELQNDYRQFGILKNPKGFNSSKYFRRLIGSGCFRAKCSDVSTLNTDDEIVVSETKRFRVVSISPDSYVLLNPINSKPLVSGEVGRNIDSLLTFTLSEVLPPEVNKFSGDIQYINNQMGIDYSDQQTLVLRTVIRL